MKNTIVQTRPSTQPKYTKFRGKTLRETRYVVAPPDQARYADLQREANKQASIWRESKRLATFHSGNQESALKQWREIKKQCEELERDFERS